MRKLTTEEFIHRAREVHGDKFDYSKVVYNGNKIKVCIICPIHGEFWQTPLNHIQGQDCPECAKQKMGHNKLSKDEFVVRAKDIFWDKFDYSKVEYKGMHVPVIIICPTHGDFEILPNSFLRSQHGCPKCGWESAANMRKLSFDEFVLRANIIHGKKYAYPLCEYKTTDDKIQIICPIHGIFEQSMRSHLNGRGCPHCNESHGEKEIAKWLNSHNILYKREYFITPTQVLFGRNKFRVDFYLPICNTIIEFNGRQHYEDIDFYNRSTEQFQVQQDRDQRLREHCKQNKIRLIEIPYTEIDNIDKILTKKILKSKKI